MKQFRVARRSDIKPGEDYVGRMWLPDRPDCYQDYELVLDLQVEAFGEGSHWFERREIDDAALDPEYLIAHEEIKARLYGAP